MFGDMSIDDEAPPSGDVQVVRIRGPLMHRAGWWFDSYDGVKARVVDAIASGAKKVILDIDSPGGVVSGAFETARELRSMTDEADVELHAFVDSQATSAGYAIASAATHIGVTATAELGSIGVICPLISVAERNKMDGLTVLLVTSGDRKGDGWPEVPTSEGAVAAKQKSIDTLAEMFFSTVSDLGWVGSSDDVRAMQASIVHGEEAVALGLATQITTLEQMISGDDSVAGEEGNDTMAKTMNDARSALEAVAEGDNEDEAKRAKAALAAMDEDEDAKAEEPDDEPDAEEGEDDDAPDAPDDEPDAEEGEDDEDAKSVAAAHRIAAKALAKSEKLERAAARAVASDKMSTFLSTRKDLSKDLLKSLSNLTLKEAKAIAAGIPKGTTREENVAAAATATGVQGAPTDAAYALSPADQARLDSQMGMTKSEANVVETPFKISFGVQVPAKG